MRPDHFTHTEADAGRYDRGSAHGEDRPSRAEAEADEHDTSDPFAGTVACPRGCGARFWGYYTAAALRHAARQHGLVVEPPEADRTMPWGWRWDRAVYEALAAEYAASGPEPSPWGGA